MRELDALRSELPAEVVLKKLFDKAHGSIQYRFERLARHMALRRESSLATLRHVAVLNHIVRPNGEPQERVYCCAQFLERFPRLPELLLERLDPLAPVHHIVTLP